MLCSDRPHWLARSLDAFGPLITADSDLRARYSADAWPLGIKRRRAGLGGVAPAAVAYPRCTADVSRILAFAHDQRIPVTPWGAGSSVTGAPLPGPDALVMDLRGLNRILSIDETDGHVRAEAGLLGSTLEDHLAARNWSTWFSPQSLQRSTVGGWVATRATGQFSSRFGGIDDAVAAMTVVLADGTVASLGSPPRGALGPDLLSLFIGSEGALGVITEIVLRLHPRTPLYGIEAYQLDGVDRGLSALREVMQSGLRPAVLRLYDANEARHLGIAGPSADAVLLTAFAGHEEVAAAESAAVGAILGRAGAHELGPGPTETWLQRRYDFSAVERLLDTAGGYAETIEVAATWSKMPRVYRDMTSALSGVADKVLGHFSHAYTDGISLYLILLGQSADDERAVAALEAVWAAAKDTALQSGAVISHHHGIGKARLPYLATQLGTGEHVLRALKRALDPRCLLHPGSLIPAATNPDHEL